MKKEVKNKKDKLLNDDSESKISKSLIELVRVWKKNETLHDILESKLIKLGMTSLQVDKIKESVLSF